MENLFFKEIIYSSSNEDSESERKALKINSNDIILCITGSGSRSLDLLVDSPKKVISIDFNETQNFLLELKIAAFKVLNYEELILFLGIGSSIDRLQIFTRLKPHLSKKTLTFWSKNLNHINQGVLFCGKWERILKALLRLFSFRNRTKKKLINSSSIEVQRNIWNKKWDNIIWKMFIKIISNRFLWIYIIREPGARLIPKTFDVYQYMKSRIDYLANNFLIKENHFANLLFHGNYFNSCTLPHHLRKENFELIRMNLDKIEIVNDSILNYLTYKKNEISAFSLSDFSSYAPEETYYSIWEKILQASTENAKFCERFFLVKKDPEKLFNEIKRNSELENSLLLEDEAVIYTFCVGSINKNKTLCH